MSTASISNPAAKVKLSAKKSTKKIKDSRRIPIHHDLSDVNQHREHRINIAITRIN